jgi:hypothetical protein
MKIDFTQIIKATPEQVLDILVDHNNLSRFFNAKISMITEQNSGEIVGGKGAVRLIKIGPISFKEQVLIANTERFSYKIVGKGPVSEHQGDIYLKESSSENSKLVTHLHYVITCKAPFFLPDGLAKYFIEKDIKLAMKNIATYFENKVGDLSKSKFESKK